MEESGVVVSYFLFGLDLFVKNIELGQQYGRLQSIQAAVHANPAVVIAPVLAVACDLPEDGRQFLVIGKDGAAVAAVAAQRFGGEEAGAADSGQVAGFLSLVGGAPKLWAPSSMTGRLCFSAMALMASKSAHWPYSETGIMALVRSVMASSISAGAML